MLAQAPLLTQAHSTGEGRADFSMAHPWVSLDGVVGRRAALGDVDLSCRCRRRCRNVAVLRAIVRRLLSVQRVPRSEIVVLQGEVRDAADRVAHYRRDPQSCAMRFGICRIAAGHRMRRHSPICPGMPSLTVGKDLGQRLAS